MSNRKQTPGIIEKIGYGLGDFSNNGFYTFISTYVMFYYTDVADLSLGAVSLIMTLGRVVDAIFSVLMGRIVDRTSTRMGKCRPFQLIGILPASLLLIFMFSIPLNGTAGQKSALAMVGYMLFSIAFAFINVPYTTMLSVLTPDHKERISFNFFKMVGANLSGIFVTAVTLNIVRHFDAKGMVGFTAVAVIFAGLFLVTGLVCVFSTKEHVKTESNSMGNVSEFLQVAKQSFPWLILCSIQFLALTYQVTRNQAVIYYAKYYLENESLSSFLLMLNPIIGVIVSMFMPAVAKKMGMRFNLVTGNVIWCISMLGTWFFGENVRMVIAFHVLACVGWNVATSMVFVMLSQTVDYAQWKTGKRPQGMFTAVMTFVQKLGIAFAGFICSGILELGGYVANQPAGAETLFSIKILFCGVPFILSVLVLVLVRFYHMDSVYPKIETELAGRYQYK